VWVWLQEEDDKEQKKKRKEDEEARKREALSFHVLSVPRSETSCKWCPNKEKLKKMKEEERLKHEVLHMGSSHLYVPNQAISEATSGASTQATS
jgi:hypothetical protein